MWRVEIIASSLLLRYTIRRVDRLYREIPDTHNVLTSISCTQRLIPLCAHCSKPFMYPTLSGLAPQTHYEQNGGSSASLCIELSVHGDATNIVCVSCQVKVVEYDNAFQR